MSDLATLAAHLRGMGRVVLGYSGGVDSGLLAVVGHRAAAPGAFLAVLGVSPSLAASQRAQAEALARQFGIPLRALATRELDDPRYAANPSDRCFFCKAELWERLQDVAREGGFDAIVDGTNADDLQEHRPGSAAAAAAGVRSPLVELGWTKAMVRAGARAIGLPIWDAPAAPCLASRIRYGLPVTPERLRQVEAAEAALRALGIAGNLRVRHLGEAARVEVDPDQFARLDGCWDEVEAAFGRLGFRAVTRDAAGYRRGALLELAVV